MIWYYTNMVDLLLDMGRKLDALDVIDCGARALPNNPTAWARRGQVLRRLSRYDQAVESYNRAIELDPSYAWAWNGRGLAYARSTAGKTRSTTTNRRRLLNGDDVWFWHNYGEALTTVGAYERAVEIFERALALDPTHEPTRRKLAAGARPAETERNKKQPLWIEKFRSPT